MSNYIGTLVVRLATKIVEFVSPSTVDAAIAGLNKAAAKLDKVEAKALANAKQAVADIAANEARKAAAEEVADRAARVRGNLSAILV